MTRQARWFAKVSVFEEDMQAHAELFDGCCICFCCSQLGCNLRVSLFRFTGGRLLDMDKLVIGMPQIKTLMHIQVSPPQKLKTFPCKLLELPVGCMQSQGP